ncbi:hypothetical protein FFK22_037555 [Mycobacterium sp. KBS0706]|uniref:hypothetical protein n=1 Tax=Mycobacterium sp. KBS0706 TaxID=2578109 RepID=UPI00110FC1CF|nr:hypothetical protein [Mycobacterium sp. KBS0706]TSD83483.1 hypothetical protein FFK22_037555 [Mycobacterium sp. KBS0706]
MADYSGFFVRDNLGQTPSGGQDRSGWSGCPDIILNGTTPAENPSDFTTADGYATDYGDTVQMEAANYVYLRALNATSGPLSGSAWLYYAEGDLALWPSKWQRANIQVGGEAMNYLPIAATAANQICVTGRPFIWTPPAFQSGHSASDHYCVISWMENPPLKPPPWTPLDDIPGFTVFDDLVDFILAHPNMGWRNTTDVSGNGPSWQETTSITGPVGGGSFFVGVAWQGMPTDGGTIGYTIPGGPNGDPPTYTQDPQPIKRASGSLVSQQTWPENFASSITISYTQGSTAPPKGAWIAPYVGLISNQMRARTLNVARQSKTGWLRGAKILDVLGRGIEIEDDIFVIGSTPYRF